MTIEARRDGRPTRPRLTRVSGLQTVSARGHRARPDRDARARPHPLRHGLRCEQLGRTPIGRNSASTHARSTRSAIDRADVAAAMPGRGSDGGRDLQQERRPVRAGPLDRDPAAAGRQQLAGDRQAEAQTGRPAGDRVRGPRRCRRGRTARRRGRRRPGAMPGPWSVDVDPDDARPRARRVTATTPPAGLCAIALATTLRSARARWPGSAQATVPGATATSTGHGPVAPRAVEGQRDLGDRARRGRPPPAAPGAAPPRRSRGRRCRRRPRRAPPPPSAPPRARPRRSGRRRRSSPGAAIRGRSPASRGRGRCRWPPAAGASRSARGGRPWR